MQSSSPTAGLRRRQTYATPQLRITNYPLSRLSQRSGLSKKVIQVIQVIGVIGAKANAAQGPALMPLIPPIPPHAKPG